MTKLIRNCAGGVVFAGEDVFLLKNDKGEWIMPKGVIRDRQNAHDVALSRVETEAGIEAKIFAPVGETNYEFYSQTRHKNVSNRIQWFAMRAKNRSYRIAFEQGFLDGDYYSLEIAERLLTHEQDRAVLKKAQSILASISEAE